MITDQEIDRILNDGTAKEYFTRRLDVIKQQVAIIQAENRAACDAAYDLIGDYQAEYFRFARRGNWPVE